MSDAPHRPSTPTRGSLRPASPSATRSTGHTAPRTSTTAATSTTASSARPGSATRPGSARSAPTAAAKPSATPAQSDPSRSLNIIKGFTLNKMTLRDADNGKLFWESSPDWKDVLTKEQTAKVPRDILKSKAVSREINFSSAEVISNFKLVQRVYLHDTPIEEWDFTFGFVIPGSTNTWQSTIEAAPESQMLPPEVLSGNVVIETSFYDAEFLIAKSKVRVFYI